jgi:polyhydroxyalkanoate synthase
VSAPGDTTPFRVDAAALLDEVQLFQERLATGVGLLRGLDKVTPGGTPREAIYREDKLTLYHYRPERPQPGLGPLLIVYALVNRPTMTDLQADRSLIRGLLEAGLEVYLVDWGYPDDDDRGLTLDTYVNGYLDRCVDAVSARHDGMPVNLLGICQGGTLSLCYAALHPERIARLVTMVTPVDFQTPDNLLGAWARELDVDLLVDSMGNIPGGWLNWVFMALKPFRLTGQKYVDLVDLVDDPAAVRNFLRMEHWIFDSPDQAGEAFRQFVKACYQQNALVNGTLELGDRRVDLANVTMPVLNVYATADHLVPPSASLALAGRVGSDDYTEYAFRGGHIGIYVSSRARKVPAEIVEWIAARADVPAREETGLGKGGKKRDGKKRKKKGAKGGKKAKRKAGKAAS